ncbi:MAG: hypothetical protein ACLU3I_11015 [Acutalibacteraceae bacterium]
MRDTVQIVESSVTTLQELADAALSEETGSARIRAERLADRRGPGGHTATAGTRSASTEYYYDAGARRFLYLDTYGHLPGLLPATKEEARALGWEAAAWKRIGAGSRHRRRPSAGNREGASRWRKQEEPIPNATSARSARIPAGPSG